MDAILVLKATILLAAVLVLARGVRRLAAAGRHRLWSLAFVALLTLPALAVTLPRLAVPVPAAWAGIGPAAIPQRGQVEPAVATRTPRSPAAQAPQVAADSLEPAAASPEAWPSFRTVLAVVWAAGALAALVALLVSLFRVRQLAARAEAITDSGWCSAAAAISARLGLRRPARLLASPAVTTPMAGGLVSPSIFLPASAFEWSDERRDLVLAHEIAHLAALDPLRHIVARCALSLYWFHPLAWAAAREAAAAREQACDEAVLALGTRRSDYARVLLEMAESMRPAHALATLPMVERSLLENRVMSILDSSRPSPASRRYLVPAIAVTLLTLGLAVAHPSIAIPDAGWPVDGLGQTPAKVAAPATVPAVDRAAAQPAISAGCGGDFSRTGTFRGSTSTADVGGRTEISEQVGTNGYDWIIQKTVGDTQVCLRAENIGSDAGEPSRWIGRARRVVMEARRAGGVQRMEFGPQSSPGTPVSWQVNGAARPVDEIALQWRDRMLAVLDSAWQLSTLRGQVSSLHGEISSLHGERSSLQGEISSLQGEVSSLQGEVSAARGEESSLQGEISAIRGQASALQGAISSEMGTISALNASRSGLNDAERRQLADIAARHNAEIARTERELRTFDADGRVAAVERRIAALGTTRKVEALEKQVRDFNLDARVAEIERRIAALDVDGKVAAIEPRIGVLDADRRGRELEQALTDAARRLDTVIRSIR